MKRRKITILWRVKIHHLFSDKHFWRLGRETLLATSQLLSRRLRIQSCKLSLKTVYFWWQPLTNTITGFKRIKNPAHFQKSRQELFFFSNNMNVWFNCGNWSGVEKNWLGAKSDTFHNSEAKQLKQTTQLKIPAREIEQRLYCITVQACYLTWDPLASTWITYIIRQLHCHWTNIFFRQHLEFLSEFLTSKLLNSCRCWLCNV